MANVFDQGEELHNGTVRSTYLITYSRADLKIFPTRKSFADAVVESFQHKSSSKASVKQWVCCAEKHADGAPHYHIAIKLTEPKRWKSAKNYLMERYEISVHFSTKHDNYYSAYLYATEEDKQALHSDAHPNLRAVGSPKTKACTKATRRKAALGRKASDSGAAGEVPGPSGVQSGMQSNRKRRRLSNLEVSEILLQNEIKREVELLALANEQKAEGKKDLAEYVFGKSEKGLQELIATTWKMNEAMSAIQRESRSRMETIRNQAENGNCVEGCAGEWLTCANEVLKQNNVHPYVFAAALRDLLLKGRGKFRNIIIVGPANCGKTFLLSPLTSIFQTFANPATTSYAWLGVEKAEIILLNDFR